MRSQKKVMNETRKVTLEYNLLLVLGGYSNVGQQCFYKYEFWVLKFHLWTWLWNELI
jgi:hypothetical protein